MAFYAFNLTRINAQIARVHADLSRIGDAIAWLEGDTNLSPSKLATNPCVQDPETYLDSCAAGILCTDGGYPDWDGPYMKVVPKDPWGNRYMFDADFNCTAGNPAGCEDFSGTVRAIHSGGPNKSGINVYDSDNIVLVLCQ